MKKGTKRLVVFLTNHPSLIEKCKTVPGESDHDIVFVKASARATRTKQPQRKIFLWTHVDIEENKPDVLDFSTIHYTVSWVCSFHWRKQTVGYTVWTSLSFLKDKVPSKMTSSRFSRPWINKKVGIRRGHTREQNILAQTVIYSGTGSFRRSPNMNVKMLTIITSATLWQVTKTPRSCIHSELSETQNYAYWYAHFFPGTHDFR